MNYKRTTVQTIKESTDEFKIQFDTSIQTIHNETKKTTEALETMSYSFGTKELKIANSEDPVNATFNNRGVKVYTYKDLNTIMNEKGLGTNKLIVVGEAQIGNLKVTKAIDELGGENVWIKRGDFHAEQEEDVSFCKNSK